MKNELILVLDFGGQYNQLIARRVRDLGVYCEVIPYTTSLEEIKRRAPRGIIFTGGPNSAYDESAPKCDPAIFSLGIPILGICYGNQQGTAQHCYEMAGSYRSVLSGGVICISMRM